MKKDREILSNETLKKDATVLFQVIEYKDESSLLSKEIASFPSAILELVKSRYIEYISLITKVYRALELLSGTFFNIQAFKQKQLVKIRAFILDPEKAKDDEILYLRNIISDILTYGDHLETLKRQWLSNPERLKAIADWETLIFYYGQAPSSSITPLPHYFTDEEKRTFKSLTEEFQGDETYLTTARESVNNKKIWIEERRKLQTEWLAITQEYNPYEMDASNKDKLNFCIYLNPDTQDFKKAEELIARKKAWQANKTRQALVTRWGKVRQEATPEELEQYNQFIHTETSAALDSISKIITRIEQRLDPAIREVKTHQAQLKNVLEQLEELQKEIKREQKNIADLIATKGLSSTASSQLESAKILLSLIKLDKEIKAAHKVHDQANSTTLSVTKLTAESKTLGVAIAKNQAILAKAKADLEKIRSQIQQVLPPLQIDSQADQQAETKDKNVGKPSSPPVVASPAESKHIAIAEPLSPTPSTPTVTSPSKKTVRSQSLTPADLIRLIFNETQDRIGKYAPTLVLFGTDFTIVRKRKLKRYAAQTISEKLTALGTSITQEKINDFKTAVEGLKAKTLLKHTGFENFGLFGKRTVNEIRYFNLADEIATQLEETLASPPSSAR